MTIALTARRGRGTDAARDLLEAAIGSGNPRVVPEAHDRLGDLLTGQDDRAGAEAAYQAAIDAADPCWTPIAQLDLATVRWQRGDTAGARDLLQCAVASADPWVTASAYGVLGDLLAALGETTERKPLKVKRHIRRRSPLAPPVASALAAERLSLLQHSSPAAVSLAAAAAGMSPPKLLHVLAMIGLADRSRCVNGQVSAATPRQGQPPAQAAFLRQPRRY